MYVSVSVRMYTPVEHDGKVHLSLNCYFLNNHDLGCIHDRLGEINPKKRKSDTIELNSN